MTITVNTKAYAFDTVSTPDKVRYTGPSNTISAKDILELYRTAPKPTADFDGVARAGSKFTRTVTLAGGGTGTAIIEVSASLPVGMAQADVDSIRDDLGDLLISSNGADLFWKQDINQ